MWKLAKSRAGEFYVFALSGRIDQEQLPELTDILEAAGESQRVILDLSALKLVDWDVVKFLSACEENGVRLENCPAYILEWMQGTGSELSKNHDGFLASAGLGFSRT